jgi:hypothetical protein
VDPRRHVPRTDAVLADPRLAAARERRGIIPDDKCGRVRRIFWGL